MNWLKHSAGKHFLPLTLLACGGMLVSTQALAEIRINPYPNGGAPAKVATKVISKASASSSSSQKTSESSDAQGTLKVVSGYEPATVAPEMGEEVSIRRGQRLSRSVIERTMHAQNADDEEGAVKVSKSRFMKSKSVAPPPPERVAQVSSTSSQDELQAALVAPETAQAFKVAARAVDKPAAISPKGDGTPVLKPYPKGRPQSDGDRSSSSSSQYPMVWGAIEGADMRDTLTVWSSQAGVDFVWEGSFGSFDVLHTNAFDGTYEQAVEGLLDQYKDKFVRPVGRLYVSPQDGQRVLLIEVVKGI